MNTSAYEQSPHWLESQTYALLCCLHSASLELSLDFMVYSWVVILRTNFWVVILIVAVTILTTKPIYSLGLGWLVFQIELKQVDVQWWQGTHALRLYLTGFESMVTPAVIINQLSWKDSWRRSGSSCGIKGTWYLYHVWYNRNKLLLLLLSFFFF